MVGDHVNQLLGCDKLQCKYSGQMFTLTCKQGYDSKEFIRIVAESDLGDYYYSDECIDAWLAPGYVLEDFQNNFELPKGDVLPEYFMEWVGYLFRFWSIYTGDSIKKIYNTVTIDDLMIGYEGLHVMDWDMIVDTLNF